MGTDPEKVARVCVLDGVHRGAVIDVGEAGVSVGDRPDCDAVLSDERVDGCVVTLSLDDAGQMQVIAREGDVRLGGRTLKHDHRKALGGRMLELGGIHLGAGADLEIATRGMRRRHQKRKMLQWGGAAVASLFLVAIVGAVGGPAGAHDVPERFIAASSVERAAAGSVRSPAMELQAVLIDHDLSGSVSVDRSEVRDGHLTVLGAVTPQERERWNEVARWFDGRYGGRIVLDARLENRDGNIVLPFRIVSLKTKPFPSVSIQDGRSFQIGSTLPGGWEVARIDGMTVVLARAGRELTIAF